MPALVGQREIPPGINGLKFRTQEDTCSCEMVNAAGPLFFLSGEQLIIPNIMSNMAKKKKFFLYDLVIILVE